MATKKSSTKKPVKKAASTVKKTTTKVTNVSVKAKGGAKLDNKTMSYVVLAELVGTFILTSVAVLTLQAADLGALFVGLTLAVLVMSIGVVSGSHVNPAVTFGLWSVGKLKAVLVPVYWAAQFLGALLAVVLMNAISGASMNLDFSKWAEFDWNIAGIEFVAAAVFLFGLVSVLGRKELSDGTKALGIGLSLFVALAVGTSFYNEARAQAVLDYQEATQSAEGSEQDIPRAAQVTGVTVNPAVATAVTEASETDLGTGEDDTKFSRLGLEVVVGTLLGAALGANVARVLQRR